MLQLKLIIEGYSDKTLKLIQAIDAWQIALIEPKNFRETDQDNFARTMELSFENLCTAMESLGVNNVRDLTVFQFYAKLTYFEKRKRQQQDQQRRR